VVRLLIAAGADPNVRPAPDDEAPLHWAASSDDADVAEALIDGGADLEAPDGSIGTPLDKRRRVRLLARRPAARGPRRPVDKLWHAGALGLLDRLDELLYADGVTTTRSPRPSGMPALAVNDARPSCCSVAVPI